MLKPFISLFLFFLGFAFLSTAQSFQYGTKNPQALAHYQQGWKEILDLGEWTKAEESFRKSVELDSEFLLGWSQVGRISNDSEERKVIFAKLKTEKSSLEGFEKELLEMYLGSLEIIDLKDRGLAVDPSLGKTFLSNLYETSQNLLMEYPAETYIEAEYIEAIHAIDGAQAAIDSMEQREILDQSPFFRSYQALLLSELKEFELANQALNKLGQMLVEDSSPAYLYTKGNILKNQGKTQEALEIINQCLALDPKHTLARRLQKVLSGS